MIILFGSTGDLARRKLIPAIMRLQERKELAPSTPVVCLGRAEFTQEEYLGRLGLDGYSGGKNVDGFAELKNSIIYLPFDLGSGLSRIIAYVSEWNLC